MKKTKRSVLITGASRGIGYACALRFATCGYHVIATARTTGGLEQLDDEIYKATKTHATLVPLDLTDDNAIDHMASSIYQRFGGLDVLVGNAGMLGALSPVSHYKPQQFFDIININMLVNFRLIRAFDAMLQKSSAPRAIFTTSSVSGDGRAFWGPYGASKAGLESLVKTYAKEVASISNLKVNLVDPGKVATKMRAEAYPGEDGSLLSDAKSITDIFIKLASVEFNETGGIFKAIKNKKPTSSQ